MADLPVHFAAAIGARQPWTHLVRSPGRINIIGEHVDYNGGAVLPAAIQQACYFVSQYNKEGQFHFRAIDLGDEVRFTTLPDRPVAKTWVNYLLGIFREFTQLGHHFSPLTIAFGGDLPRGAGLSSSAALEGGLAFLLNEISGAGLDRPALARLCQRSSNNFMGVPSGIMDQFASLNGRAGHAILLDCDSLKHEFIPAELPGYRFVLLDSGVDHDHASGAYARRVAECNKGLAALQRKYPELTTLAAAAAEQLAGVQDQISPEVHQRCRYVIAEGERTRRAVAALRRGDAPTLGQLLNATHAGLSDDYEVSCAEIDFLQAVAERQAGVAGARLMGGGFGGCTLNLVREDRINKVVEIARRAYADVFGRELCYFVSQTANGTELL